MTSRIARLADGHETDLDRRRPGRDGCTRDGDADGEPDGAELVGTGTTGRAHRRSRRDGDDTATLFEHDIERAGP